MWTRIHRFSCGRGQSADPPNKHICGRGPSADLKPRVLFARQTSNGSANVPLLRNLRTDPCGALGIVYWIHHPTLLADADGPQT